VRMPEWVHLHGSGWCSGEDCHVTHLPVPQCSRLVVDEFVMGRLARARPTHTPVMPSPVPWARRKTSEGAPIHRHDDFSQPDTEVATNKNIPTKQAKKMMRMISMSRLWHPSTRTCQGVLSVLMVCGFLMAATLPQCHRILLETNPTTPARMTPITNPKSPGPRLSPIRAPFSGSSEVLYHTTGRGTIA